MWFRWFDCIFYIVIPSNFTAQSIHFSWMKYSKWHFIAIWKSTISKQSHAQMRQFFSHKRRSTTHSKSYSMKIASKSHSWIQNNEMRIEMINNCCCVGMRASHQIFNERACMCMCLMKIFICTNAAKRMCKTFGKETMCSASIINKQKSARTQQNATFSKRTK